MKLPNLIKRMEQIYDLNEIISLYSKELNNIGKTITKGRY